MNPCNSARPHADHRVPSQHRISLDCSSTEREGNRGPLHQNTVVHLRSPPWASQRRYRSLNPSCATRRALSVLLGLLHGLSESQMADLILSRRATLQAESLTASQLSGRAQAAPRRAGREWHGQSQPWGFAIDLGFAKMVARQGDKQGGRRPMSNGF